MNEDQKEKLSALKKANKEYTKILQQKNNILLQECFLALNAYQIINEETLIKHLTRIASENKVTGMLYLNKPVLEREHDYYVVWDNADVPIIKCKGHNIVENWNDVIAVSFDTYFIDCETGQSFLIKE